MNAQNNRWHVVMRPEDVPESGLVVSLAADEADRKAIAQLADVPEITRAEARFEVQRRGRDGLHVAGLVSGAVVQSCVVTLEPLTSEVEEAVDLSFVPEAHEPAALDNLDLSDAAADQPEALENGQLDLGALAAEFLMLAIDPYPRKAGAVFEPLPAGKEPAGPFAALANLKRAPS